ERGRLPDDSELDLVRQVRERIGTLRYAWRIVERATGAEAWARIREERSQDLLIYFALARFGRRPRLAELPPELQSDVKAFFGTYSRATEDADRLLFSAGDLTAIEQACQKSPVGKLTPDALYIHVSARGSLPPILRVYEGCARSYIG